MYSHLKLTIILETHGDVLLSRLVFFRFTISSDIAIVPKVDGEQQYIFCEYYTPKSWEAEIESLIFLLNMYFLKLLFLNSLLENKNNMSCTFTP